MAASIGDFTRTFISFQRGLICSGHTSYVNELCLASHSLQTIILALLPLSSVSHGLFCLSGMTPDKCTQDLGLCFHTADLTTTKSTFFLIGSL